MANNVINRTCFEFVVSDQNLAIQLKQGIDSLLNDKLLPKLDQLFADYVSDEDLLIVDKLELDLGDIGFSELESALLDAIESKIPETILAQTGVIHADSGSNSQIENIKKSSRINRKVDALIHFFETGLLPWWNRGESPEELLTIVLKENPDKLFRFFNQNKSDLVWKRFYKQFPRKLIEKAIKQKVNSNYAILKKLESGIKNLALLGLDDDVYKQSVWKFVFEKSIDIKALSDAVIKRHFEIQKLNSNKAQIFYAKRDLIEKIKALASDSPLKNSLENWRNKRVEARKIDKGLVEGDNDKIGEQSKPSSSNIEETEINKLEVVLQEGLIIDHAGLVILSPFLSLFFKNIGLVKDKEFVSEKAQEQAVLICEFLTTGSLNIKENQAVISKVLCGFPLNKTFESQLKISKRNRKEVENLLESVIQNWSAIGKTSKSGLQRAFLQREGRLVETDNKFLLMIERLGQDALLDRLPWSIGIIRLPWMTKLLEVEW